MLKDNLKSAFASRNLYVKEVAAKAKVKKATIDNWLSASKTKEPRSLDLYAVCRAINITMEQAIDGEAGLEYVRSVLKEDGTLFAPPERISDIVRDVLNLTDDELVPVRGVISAIVENKKRGQRQEASA
jgi:transcriptional regulator with XRE-family HTH domain